MGWRAFGCTVLLACVAVVPISPSLASARTLGRTAPVPPVRYEPPIAPGDGRIVDRFRAPPGPYAAGNRGLDYATTPLAPVRAAADGEVIFAGPVAGTLQVTVRHADGLRSSYSYLAALAVRAGQRVRQGEQLGVAADVFHFGVRDPDGTYLDPEALFGAPRAHLVPGGDDGASNQAGAADADRPAPESRPESFLDGVRLWMHNATEIRPDVHARRVVAGLTDWFSHEGACTPTTTPSPRPASRHILVEVGGLGSTSESASITRVDAAGLGIAPADVVRFSYRGGRVAPSDDERPPPASATNGSVTDDPVADRPPDTDDLHALPVTAYGVADSEGDLVATGRRLDELLQRIAVTAPGVPIVVVAHSQGGVVARLALDPSTTGHAVPSEVRTLVTLATPHQGADLAAVIASARSSEAGAALLERVATASGVELDPGSAAARQLVPTSSVVRHLADVAPPPSVWFTSVGVRGDLVVAANRAAPSRGGPETHHTILPLGGPRAHDQVTGDPATTREIALAVAGLPPTCRGLVQVATDLVVAESVSLAEATVAVPAAGLAGGLRWPVPQGSP
jgi:hypothetical protein